MNGIIESSDPVCPLHNLFIIFHLMKSLNPHFPSDMDFRTGTVCLQRIFPGWLLDFGFQGKDESGKVTARSFPFFQPIQNNTKIHQFITIKRLFNPINHIFFVGYQTFKDQSFQSLIGLCQDLIITDQCLFFIPGNHHPGRFVLLPFKRTD